MKEEDKTINPEYQKKYMELVLEGVNDDEAIEGFKKIRQDIYDLTRKQMMKEDLLKRKYIEIVTKDVLDSVKRIVVSYDKWIEDGMHECVEDITQDEDFYETFQEKDNAGIRLKKGIEDKLKKLYNELVEKDSRDVVMYVSDRFKDYSGSKEFYSLESLESEIKSCLDDDTEQFYEDSEFIFPYEVRFYSKKIHDFFYQKVQDDLAREGFYAKDEKN